MADFKDTMIAISSFLLLCLATVAIATDQDADIATTVMLPTTTQHWYLHVTHDESSTSSITIQWDVPQDYDIIDYRVETRRIEKTDDEKSVLDHSVLNSPILADNATEYTVENLVTSAEFQVCLYVSIGQCFEFDHDTVEKDCQEYFTIDLIRPDSVYVLFIVIGYILLMCLLGYLAWYRTKARLEKLAAGEEEEEEEEEPQEDEKAQLTKPMLAPLAQGERPSA